jgi:hypothetical protein
MGLFGSDRYNRGRSWHLDRQKFNTQEDWEKPMKNRKLRYSNGGGVGMYALNWTDHNGQNHIQEFDDYKELLEVKKHLMQSGLASQITNDLDSETKRLLNERETAKDSQDYARITKELYDHYETLRYANGGGVGDDGSSLLAHYEVGDAVFVDYMDAVDYCDENNIDYSEIIKLKEYATGGAVKVSNREARYYVENMMPFKANNLEGKFKNGVYVVLSYGYYPIFIYKDGRWFENLNKYSSSTGKQMSQTRPDKTSKISREEMDYLMNTGELKNPVFDLFDYGGTTMTDEMTVRDNCANGEIHCHILEEIIGCEPSYPYHHVGSLKLEKCFLRPYYRICH